MTNIANSKTERGVLAAANPRRTRNAAVCAAATGALCCALFGCDQAGPRVYTAMPYDSETHCLDTYQPLGLVDAEELPSSCDPVCLMRDDALYVSVVCPPYPAEVTLVQATGSTDCAAALALVGTDGGGACSSDGDE